LAMQDSWNMKLSGSPSWNSKVLNPSFLFQSKFCLSVSLEGSKFKSWPCILNTGDN
jgi:hypothetical protein